MAGGAGFLIYSRKVLVPQQRAAMQKKPAVPPPTTQQRPLLRRPLSKPTQPSLQQLRAGIKPESKLGVSGTAGLSGAGAKSDTKEQGAKPSAQGEASEEYIDISELGKQAEKTGKPGDAKATAKKPSGDIFKRLKDLIASRKKKPQAEVGKTEKTPEKKDKEIEKKAVEKK
jgi:hypothetical protein